jgi:hypothetical protein
MLVEPFGCEGHGLALDGALAGRPGRWPAARKLPPRGHGLRSCAHLSFNCRRWEEAGVPRRPRLARLAERAWRAYDDLSDPQRVGLGVVMALVLAASSLYCFGAATLLAVQRYPLATEIATPTPSPAPSATVEPISPLLAERTPTLRPTATPLPPRLAPTATPTARLGLTPPALGRTLTPLPTRLPWGSVPQATPAPPRGGVLTPTPLSRPLR